MLKARALLVDGLVLSATILTMISPLKIIYPLSQGNYQARYDEMLESRAQPYLKPSTSLNPSLHMALRGIPFGAVWTNLDWYRYSARSFYGYFGWVSVALPDWVYATAATLISICVMLTLGFAIRQRAVLPDSVKVVMLIAPFIVILNIFMSLYNSWTADYQPQGRYLYSALIPLALGLMGTFEYEPRWLQRVRLGLGAILIGLCFYSLWSVVFSSKALMP